VIKIVQLHGSVSVVTQTVLCGLQLPSLQCINVPKIMKVGWQ